MKFLKLGPKIRRAKRNEAATGVQKYLRGYLAHKHCYKMMASTKIDNNAAFFKTIKD